MEEPIRDPYVDIMAECCYCKKIKACTFTVDPFLNDVYDGKDGDGRDLESDWWCEECIEYRAADI